MLGPVPAQPAPKLGLGLPVGMREQGCAGSCPSEDTGLLALQQAGLCSPEIPDTALNPPCFGFAPQFLRCWGRTDREHPQPCWAPNIPKMSWKHSWAS